MHLDDGVPKEVTLGDWLVVSFEVKNKKSKEKSKRFICQVVRAKNGRLIGDFVKPKFTKQQTGYVYNHPQVKDLTKFKYDQIIRKISAPKPYGRHGLLQFCIHANHL